MSANSFLPEDYLAKRAERRTNLICLALFAIVVVLLVRMPVPPDDALRNQLVPLNKKYPLKMLLESCNNYMSRLGEKRVLTVEYTLLKDVNDQPEHAEQMIELLRDTPCKVNLIPFNPFPHSGYERPSNNVIRRFQDMLHKAGYNVTVRITRGEDIDAACGQLVGQVADKTRRSARYIAVRQLAEDGQAEPQQSAVGR